MFWDDGVPLIIEKEATRESGGIVIFNAIPVSSEIFGEQWHCSSGIFRALRSAIISVAGVSYHR
jgi:hypothetical protein